MIGQNGAGKSTMIKILTGYYSRDAGEILFDGAPWHVDSPKSAQRSGISTIYQEINLVSYRSVTENICLGREKKRFGFLDWRHMHREAEEILARFNIHIDVRQPLSRHTTAAAMSTLDAGSPMEDHRSASFFDPQASTPPLQGPLATISEAPSLISDQQSVPHAGAASPGRQGDWLKLLRRHGTLAVLAVLILFNLAFTHTLRLGKLYSYT